MPNLDKYDFGGYVTRNDLRCSDGRIIRAGAFAHCDKARVPLLYQHRHNEVENVLGFVDLENRPDGVYGWGSFNSTPAGTASKEQVKHGDLTQMSIYANHLVQEGPNVIKGDIREVSLVLSGANPGAYIDNLNFVHADGSFDVLDDEAIIHSNEPIFFMHAEDPSSDDPKKPETTEDTTDETTVQSIYDNMSDEKKQVVDLLMQAAVVMANEGESEEVLDGIKAKVGDKLPEGRSVQDIYDSFTEEERTVTEFLVTKALDLAEEDDPDDIQDYDDEEEGDDMPHSNIFEDNGYGDDRTYLTHADQLDIISAARERGSLKAAFETYMSDNGYDGDTLSHGIQGIDTFFPEDKIVGDYPATISRNMEWVDKVLRGVRHSPFSRIKSSAVNITEPEARAKGYVKGTRKTEEQMKALGRSTGPTTVYKLQKLDRDDVVDITDFDIISFIKAEMRVMLDEECARAYLIGDGRSSMSNDKIDEDCIRPIWTDDEVYSVHVRVANSSDASIRARNFIDAAIRAHKEYRGSGSPVLFIGTDALTDLRLLRDNIGHRLFKNDQELADELRVSSIVEVAPFDGKMRDDSGDTLLLGGIIVNLSDYTVGATRGGEVSLFDDFDLNFNKLEYLIETRQSGALQKPKAALVLEFVQDADMLNVSASKVDAVNIEDEAQAANQDRVSVSQVDNVLLITELEPLDTIAGPDGNHKYVALDIDTGLQSIVGVTCDGTQLTADDVADATAVGLGAGHFVYYAECDLLSAPKTLTLSASGYDSYDLTLRYVAN